MVADPADDRWHETPTPHYGGVAISSGILLAMMAWGANFYLLAGTGLIFLLGLLDDFVGLKPSIRGLLEFGAAGLAIFGGIGGIEPLSGAGLLALFWVVLVSNAINLIDGADGVSSSVVGATTLFGGLFLLSIGEPHLAILMWTLTAVCAGFLVFNWPPASIFMGDSGSLVLGYLLAILSLEVGFIAGAEYVVLPYVVAFAFVAVPFLDASFVAIIRILLGHSPAKGGTHHIHHRIRLSGFSPAQTATLLGCIAGLVVSSLFLVARQPMLFVTLLAFGLIALLLFEVLLVHYTGFLPSKQGETAEHKYLMRLGRWAKRVSPFPKVLADSIVVVSAVLVAEVLVQAGPASAGDLVPLLLVFVTVKLGVMWAFGLYKHQWLTSAGTPDLIRAIGSIMLASVILTVIMTFLPEWKVGSRMIMVDMMASSIGLVGMRIGFRAFRSVLGIQQRTGVRVLVYGAGLAGDFSVREMRLNKVHNMNPVGFLDDDPVKHGTRNYGLKVWGGIDELETAIRESRAERMVISSAKIPEDRAREICRACTELGIPCSRMRFSFTEIL